MTEIIDLDKLKVEKNSRNNIESIEQLKLWVGTQNRKLDDKRLLKLHGHGLSDYRISKILGVSRSCVKRHRERFGLRPNGKTKR